MGYIQSSKDFEKMGISIYRDSGLINPSVHCLYYSLINLTLKILISQDADCKDSYELNDKYNKEYGSTHKTYIAKISKNIEPHKKIKFITDFESLRMLRVFADYYCVNITKENFKELYKHRRSGITEKMTTYDDVVNNFYKLKNNLEQIL